MAMGRALRKTLPTFLLNALWRRREAKALAALPRTRCDTEVLRDRPPQLKDISDWAEVAHLTEAVSARGGAVNPGDARALYTLTRTLQPASVLEIGTHLGGSTLMFALALKRTPGANLTTVDILDVSGPDGAYLRFGGKPPRQVIAEANCTDITTFVTSESIAYLQSCNRRFDLIFLDGCHDATNVYKEIPLALRCLNPGGLILLHDFFPNLAPLWSDGVVIPGPWLAVARLRKEGARVAGVPLGSLQWPTKLGSNVTSLAYLVQADDAAHELAPAFAARPGAHAPGVPLTVASRVSPTS